MSKCKVCQKDCKWTFCSNPCKMKYRHAHKDEYADYFEKLRQGAAKRRKYSAPCLECGGKTPRHYNKFCSRICAEKYRKEHKYEYQSSYDASAKKNRRLPDMFCTHCGNEIIERGKNRKFCSDKCCYEYRTDHPIVIPSEVRSRANKKFQQNNKKRFDEIRKASSERMKRNNPAHNPEVLARIKVSCKKYWDEHPEERDARIKRFMQAPVRGRGKEWKPTSFELKIMELNIPGLKYKGDGNLFVTIGCSRKRKKNPDFILVGKKKVVEVGDTEYWHTMEEIKQTIADYQCSGFECLYLTTDHMRDKSIYEKLVRDFCSAA